VVRVYKGSMGGVWEAVRVIGGGFGGPGSRDGQLDRPKGLRFSGDGSAIVVADSNNDRASVFRVADGGFLRHMATGLSHPFDVEEVEGGWLAACWGAPQVHFVGTTSRVGGRSSGSLGSAGGGRGGRGDDGQLHYPTALAAVPGLGLVLREHDNWRLVVFANPNEVAMAAMSPWRVAWMGVVVRGALRRQRLPL
jgi:hypothetical protein